ncbi:hypoxanthine phosphoribosyltransferase [Flavihumibacter petaseus]|uniref:Hypoxanthine phosphoribosyltransferase n=1 Tax=Flavihumibacter petaseus NBRC 106054 TaxID=1220578 RepID=A0A0E9MW16_9BACT|nr:hypoxanthine phosphoribosyltransferase [Flavihumibacter petaseus]GAO41320.1 hypoxanthine phosphoribosyltransferase [Flavihumibacter petaseus NBRC 106054]
MPTVNIRDKVFEPYLTAAAIQEQVHRIAAAINHDYAGKRPLFISILNGSFIFAADLFKAVTIDAEICFIKLASYKGTKSTGQVITAIGLDTDIHQRHVIILEDIVDTGKTLHEFLPQLHHQQPASLELAVLLHKPSATQFPIGIKYLGFSIPDKFVLGYGLDFDGLGRNIPEIYRLKEE